MIFAETERLLLRDFEIKDIDDVHEYASNYENVKHMVFGPNTFEQTKIYIEQKCAAEKEQNPRIHYNIAIESKDGKKVIGGISLHLNWRLDDGIIGAILNRSYGGRNYMFEALQGVLAFAFGTLKLHRIHAVCDVNNKRMIHLLEKSGFRNEGCMVQRGKNRPEEPEEYFDQFAYALLASEWNFASK